MVVTPVCQKFKVGKKQQGSFKYVGLHITKGSKGIIINQDEYAAEIQDVSIDQGERSNEDQLSTSEIRILRSIIGQIQWVSSQTRPDLSFDALDLSVERNRATVSTMKRARKVIKKLKSNKSEVVVKAVGNPIKLKVFPDAGLPTLKVLLFSLRATTSQL